MFLATKFEVEVTYNGLTKPVEVEAHQQVTAVLQHAIHLFAVSQNPHLLSLFREDGTKVEEHQSVAAAGLQPGMLLLLRPDAVKGGG